MIFIHAGCMSAGLLLLSVGVSGAMMMRKKEWWLRVHRRCGTAGVVGVLLGLAVALYMVSGQTGRHCAVPHAWLGIITVLAVVCTYLIGVAQLKMRVPRMRPLHRWVGRVTLALLVINVLSGLSLVGVM